MTDSFITVIGKNGSGKTSLLKAIKTLFSANQYQASQEEKNALFGIEIKLSNKDYNVFFKDFVVDKESRLLHVKWISGNIRGLVVTSELLPRSLHNIQSILNDLLNQLTIDFETYLNLLYEIEYENGHGPYLNAYNLVKEDNSLIGPFTYSVDSAKKDAESRLRKITAFIEEHFQGDEYIINHDSYIPRMEFYGELYFSGIQYREFSLSPLLRKCIEIDEMKYRELITHTQTALVEVHQRIKANIDKFNQIVEGFRNLVTRESNQITKQLDQREKQAKSLIDSIEKTIRRNCYFLDNESGIMFGTTEYRIRERQNPVYVVIEDLLKEKGYLKEDENQSSLLKLPSSKKNQIEQEINQFLASVVASFDKGRIQSLESRIGEHGIELKIVELDGTMIDVNETSLGRRWYLSYNFIKHLLRPGDIFIIDEPASFLHPEAQQEILKDLESLSKKFTIIISTHSPYMLSKQSAYYETKVTNHGIEIVSINSGDLMKIRDTIGLTEYTNILFDSKAKHILVEGERDVACIKRFMNMFGIDVNSYNIFPCDGFHMAAVSRFLETHGRDFIALIDYDHFEDDNPTLLIKKLGKNSDYLKLLNSAPYFKDFIRKAKQEPNRYIFVGDEKGRGEIEDLFFGKDKEEVVDKDGKIIISKISNKKVFNNTTIDCFKSLFKRAGLL